MTDLPTTENVAQTMRDTLREFGDVEYIDPPTYGLQTPFLVSVPAGRTVQDLSQHLRDATLRMKPERRSGICHHVTLDSLITWSNRFKGDESVMFATYTPELKLTTVANYHEHGPRFWDAVTGEAGAGFADHRGVYTFPLSEEWKRWMAVSGKELTREELAEFIDNNILDVIEPTPYLLNASSSDPAPWEERCATIAEKIDGRFGQPHELVNLSRQFTINETSDLKVTANRNDGTTSLQFVNEHKDDEGRPLKLPSLFLIAIPVFDGMDLYRLTARFSYRKSSSTVKFRLQVFQPDIALRDAMEGECARAQAATQLPLMWGTPER